MTKIAERLKEIRIENRYSQKQIADMCGMAQATIGRYETDAADPSPETLLWYAETFEVSLDYIYGRTDNPNGMLYQQNANEMKASLSDERDMEMFAKMCFAPGTIINDKLKETIVSLLREETKNEE